jgi:hypothetical protein
MTVLSFSVLKMSQTVENGHETFVEVHANGQERLTVRNAKEHSSINALERKVENVHDTFKVISRFKNG